MNSLAEIYAEYAAGLRFDGLPPAVVKKAVLLLLDYVGVSIVGAPAQGQEVMAVLPGMGEGVSPVVDSDRDAHPWTAAFVNGTAAHFLDMDDGHKPTISHPAVAIFPALLALADGGHTAKDLITAAVAGYEIMCRLGTAMQPDHQSRLGFHTTGTCGTVGAASASAKLMKLTAEQTRHAIGIASLQASGLLEVMSSGVMSKPFQAGKAAAGGLLSAILAAQGMEAPDTSLDGPKGLLNAMGGNWNGDELTKDLGSRYATLDAYFKFHAACGLCHASADALQGLTREYGFGPDDVEQIELQVQSYAYEVAGKPKEIAVGTGMKFSMPHVAALILEYGDLLPLRFTDLYLHDEKILTLAEKVRVVPSAEMDETFPKLRSSRALVMLKDGRVLEKRVDAARGHPENPPEEAEIIGKFQILTEEYLGADAPVVATSILKVPELSSIDGLARNVYRRR
jgi:2-methylcitrate dehydratase PrpD